MDCRPAPAPRLHPGGRRGRADAARSGFRGGAHGVGRPARHHPRRADEPHGRQPLRRVPLGWIRPSAASHPGRSGLMSNETEIRPFRVDVPDEAIAELRRRIAATRSPSREVVADRSQGVQLATIQELTRYWTTDYDWRACEARLNALPQFTTEINGQNIHFIHVKSPHIDALPLIITHGWPGSILEMLGVIGPLTDPTAYGGRAEDAFDL